MAVTFEQSPGQWAYANSNSVAKAYGSAVSAGDLLWAFVYQTSATASPTGVSDSVNGAWTSAGSLVRGDANNGNIYVQGYYFLNSASGTPTVTASFDTSANSVIVIGVVRGLAGGGDLDQIVANIDNGPDGTGWNIGTSATLAQAEEAAVALLVMSSGPGTPLWTADVTIDGFYFERVQRTVTSATTPLQVGTSGAVGSATTAVGFAMFFKGVATGPTINTQPSNTSVTTPTVASFTVAATTSGGSLSYQWQFSTNSGSSWANVSDGTGATSASYTTSATAVSTGNHRNGYQYRCVVTDSNGTINSNAATLTVSAAAVLIADFGAYALSGQAVTLTKATLGAFTLTADGGSYVITGSSALADYAMNATYGTCLLTGQNVSLRWSGEPIVPSRGAGIYIGMRIGL